MEKLSSDTVCLSANDYIYVTMTSPGVATGTVFQEIRSGAGFKTGDLLAKPLGGQHRKTIPTRH